MGLGRQQQRQGDMFIPWDQIPKSRGHAFYDRLQLILRKAGFDLFAENLRLQLRTLLREAKRTACLPARQAVYSSWVVFPHAPDRAPSAAFSYFEGIDSEPNSKPTAA